MAEAIVSDWIAEFNSLEPEELRTFSALHAENHELSTAIHTILNDRTKHLELLHQICTQLYNFYRSTENELKYFALQFVPNMIYVYLNAVATGEKHNVRSVETFILCAYNMEVCKDRGELKSTAFRIPVLAQPSLYHEEKNLHASDLKRWEDHSNKEIAWRTMQQITKITAHNRLQTMAALMFVFNQQLSLIPKSSLYHLCKISSRLVTQGFAKFGHSYRSSYGGESQPLNMMSSSMSPPYVTKQIPRIPLSQQLLVELLNAIYFAMFNEFASAATQALEDIHTRANYELYPDVILVTSAIKNSLSANPSGQPSDGPMGISVALTPSTTVVTVSKSMITNASFRTKKLPDDIPIQDDATNHSMATQSNQPLGSINEETEIDPNNTSKTQKSGKESSSKSQKTSFGGLKKLIDRDKDKDDKDKDKDEKPEKKEKKESRGTSVLKTGLSETKENVKKLIQGSKDRSSKSSSSTPAVSTQQQPPQPPPPSIAPAPPPLQTAVVHQTSLEYDNLQSNNNGDLMRNSPMILKRADINSSENASIDMNMTTFNDKSLPDIVNMSKIDSNGSSHGIISPFESMEDSDSEEGGIEPIEHQQLSSSSSASINILMDNSNNNNKILETNVQVSQV